VTPLSVSIFQDAAATAQSSTSSSSSSPGRKSLEVDSPAEACPAFLIERIGGGGGEGASSSPPLTDKTFRKISDLCIDVFFKEEMMDENGHVK
jgi:hypothetical protein